jgi:hypothetical protein
MDARTLYIDLLKNTLSFALWPEPPVPIQHSFYFRHPLRKKLAQMVGRFFSKRGLVLSGIPRFTEEQRRTGRIWPGYAHSMIGRPRLDNIQFCVETVLKDGVSGDFIETGVWRGGSCILMKGILDVNGVTNRKVFVADSFAGLPPPDGEKYPADKGDRHHEYDVLAVSLEQVRANFAQYGVLDDNVVFLKGWFKDTLPVAPIEKLAVMRLDGDMYSSTIEALESLYPKLVPGGFCIIDDYALKGCQEAVDDFRRREGITATLEVVDWSGRFWRKPF